MRKIFSERVDHERSKALEGSGEWFDRELWSELARANGARYLLMVVPLGVQVDGRLSAELAETWSLAVAEVTHDPQSRLRRFGQGHAFEVLDLVPALRNHGGEEFYYPADGHWTPLGHRIAAEAIYKKILEEELLPELGQ